MAEEKTYFEYGEAVQCLDDVRAIRVLPRNGIIEIDAGRYGQLSIPCHNDVWQEITLLSLAKKFAHLAGRELAGLEEEED